MAVLRSRLAARSFHSTTIVDALVAFTGLLLCGIAALLTPAFTDYEQEAEPAVQALLAGHISEGLQLLPIYGNATLALMPGAYLAHWFGGGDLAVFRALAIPGAIGLAWIAVIAARWLREAGRRRAVQLTALGAIVTSACLIQSWATGHHEEALVASLALGGLIVVLKDTNRSAIIGGVLMGAATAGKLWAVVLLPVALVASTTRGRALRLTLAAGISGAILVLPVVLSKFAFFTAMATSTGGGAIFSRGNLWWFLGDANPTYKYDPDGAATLHTTANSARLAPAFIGNHSHELIVLVAVGLSAAWWLLERRRNAAAALPGGSPARPALGARIAARLSASGEPVQVSKAAQRAASILFLAAAVLWWRGLMDPWYQPYYLIPACVALVLADARRGRIPVAGLVAWGAFWLVDGQNAPTMQLLPDAKSAISLAWMVPVGIWTTVLALRSTR